MILLPAMLVAVLVGIVPVGGGRVPSPPPSGPLSTLGGYYAPPASSWGFIAQLYEGCQKLRLSLDNISGTIWTKYKSI